MIPSLYLIDILRSAQPRRLALWVLITALVMMAFWPDRTWAGQEEDWLAPPGMLYRVDNHRMHMNCTGSGSPSVILDAGLGGFSLEWMFVQESLSAQTRVCAYDRAGYGWSEPGPSPRATDQIVEELYDLLTAAGIPSPYVLVGHSFGGYNVLYFAKVHPQLTAGIVLVDASHPEQAERLADKSEPVTASDPDTGSLVTTFQPEHMLSHYPEKLRELAIVLMSTRKAIETEQREFVNFRYSGALVQQSGRLPDVPLVVVTRGQREWPDTPRGHALEQTWQAMQRDLVGLLPDARQMIADKSGHLIHLEQPEIVVTAIRSVLDRIKQAHTPEVQPEIPR